MEFISGAAVVLSIVIVAWLSLVLGFNLGSKKVDEVVKIAEEAIAVAKKFKADAGRYREALERQYGSAFVELTGKDKDMVIDLLNHLEEKNGPLDLKPIADLDADEGEHPCFECDDEDCPENPVYRDGVEW